MCTLTHLAVGGALGGCVGNGGLAALLGAASHALLDAIPHYDVEDFRVDAALAVAGLAGLLLLGYWHTPVFWGAVGGVAPDVEILLWKLGVLKESQKLFPSHNGLIRHGKPLPISALVSQGLLVLGAVSFLAFLRS